jgi:glutamate:GABA antiporter
VAEGKDEMAVENNQPATGGEAEGGKQVEARSAVFRKQLGLTDLVLTQVLVIVGLPWLGTAAKLGTSHVLFWALAILLFYLPQAVVVIYLNRRMPLEGGPYQWAKLSFGPSVGFIVAWNLWLSTIVINSMTGLSVATYLSYLLGPNAAWMAGSKWLIMLTNLLIIGALAVLTTRGLGVSKWVHNVGSGAVIAVLVALLALPFVSLARGDIAEYSPLAVTVPALSLLSFNIFGKLSFAALFGFDSVAILAGECRSPVRTISLSVIIAAPIIALVYIFGTSSVLAFVRPEDVDLIGPVAQALSVGFGHLGLGAHIATVVILLLLARELALTSFFFTTNTRLPMVAGWDRLLPAWFTKLHETYRTPINSIAFISAVTLALSLISLVGVEQQEAFQLLLNTALIFYALTYLVMFSIPLFGFRGGGMRPPLWVRVVSASGLLVTLNFVVLSVFPIIEVESWVAFSTKIISIIVAANLLGVTIFIFAERMLRLRHAAPKAE